MINETFQIINKPIEPLLTIKGNTIITGWIHSPTITIIGVVLGILIAWNIWLTYKIFKDNTKKEAEEK